MQLRRINPSGRYRRKLLLFVSLDKAVHTIRGLCALTDPVINPRQIDTHLVLATDGNGIEITQSFDVTTVAPITLIGHDDMIKRSLLGTTAR
jgi:hypothetical protein